MRIKLVFFSAFFVICFNQSLLWAQCEASVAIDKGFLIPTTNWQTQSVKAGQYYSFFGESCTSYTFSFCQGGGSSTFDTQITVTDSLGNPIPEGYNDDACGFQSELTWTCLATGTYRMYITLYSCVTTGGAGSMVAYKSEPPLVSVSNYALMNGATSNAPYNCVTLTQSGTSHGGAWANNATLDFTGSFSFDFLINLGSDDNGADGMCFVMQNDPRGRCASGDAGGSLGYAGITKSVAIEIDTYVNFEDRDDGLPPAIINCLNATEIDHLDLWLNGNINPPGTGCPGAAGARIIPSAIPFMSGATLYNVENGLDHQLRIAWNAASSTLTASLYDATGSILYGTFSYAFNPLTVFGTNYPYFGFVGATGLQSNVQSFCSPTITLPLPLLSFTGKAEGRQNILSWQTGADSHIHHFSLQRASAGKTYETVGVISPKASGGSLLGYSFTDATPPSDDNYYRLLQTGNDGKAVYSKTVHITKHYASNLGLSVFPNPVQSQLSITAPAGISILNQLEIINSLGQTVLKTAYKPTLSVASLQAGVYIINLKTAADSYTAKFVKR